MKVASYSFPRLPCRAGRVQQQQRLPLLSPLCKLRVLVRRKLEAAAAAAAGRTSSLVTVVKEVVKEPVRADQK